MSDDFVAMLFCVFLGSCMANECTEDHNDLPVPECNCVCQGE